MTEGNTTSQTTCKDNAEIPSPLNSQENRKKILIDFLAREVDRHLNISKWSGITFWGILTALIASLGFLYNNFENSISKENLEGLLIACLFTMSNAIVLGFSIYWIVLSIRKTSYQRRIISQIEWFKSVSFTNLLVRVSLVALPFITLLLLDKWNVLILNGVAIALAVGIIVKATLLKRLLNIHRQGFKQFGDDAHDYTLSFPLDLNRRLLVFGVYATIDIILIFLSTVFIWFNLWLYDLSKLGKIIPTLFAFFFVFALMFLFSRKRIDARVLAKLREIEYEIVSHDYSWPEMAILLDQKYVGFSVEEWIGIRLAGTKTVSDIYIGKADRLLEEVQAIDFESNPDKELAGKLLTSFVTVIQFEQREAVNYNKETKYHLEKIKSAEVLEPFDQIRVTIILQECEFYQKEVLNRVEKIAELSKQFENLFVATNTNANNPLDK